MDAAGRCPPALSVDVSPTITVDRVVHGFWGHAQMHYRKADGTPTNELDNYRQSLRPLRRLYGSSDAASFGPKSLKAVREHMISQGWFRSYSNRQVSRIKSVFRCSGHAPVESERG